MATQITRTKLEQAVLQKFLETVIRALRMESPDYNIHREKQVRDRAVSVMGAYEDMHNISGRIPKPYRIAMGELY